MYEFEKKKLKALLGEELYSELKDYNCYIAGGTITSLFCNREINDVDVYFRSKQDLADFLYDNVEYSKWVLAKTNKALLIDYKEKVDVQLIWFDTFNTTEDIFDTFDYTVCMGAYDFKTEEFVLHKDFLQHNSQRILKYNSKTAFPIVSALRVEKYKDKGYTISKPEFMRVLLTCMQLEIDNYDDLKEQLGGMYGVDYDEIIKPKDGESFSLEDIIEKMQDICLHDDYFKPKKQVVKIENFSKMVFEITGIKRKYLKFRDKYYAIEDHCINEIWCKPNQELYIEVDLMTDLIKDNKLYKNVKKKDGRYFSYHDGSFEYVIGGTVEPKNKGFMRSGIYCSTKENVKYATHSDKEDKVVLELEIESIDDIKSIDGDILLHKCRVIGEVSE